MTGNYVIAQRRLLIPRGSRDRLDVDCIVSDSVRQLARTTTFVAVHIVWCKQPFNLYEMHELRRTYYQFISAVEKNLPFCFKLHNDYQTKVNSIAFNFSAKCSRVYIYKYLRQSNLLFSVDNCHQRL